RPRRVVRTAWGFRSLFRDVLARHAPSLRSSLMGLLGSESTYYRYHRGERRLTPEQQQEVARIFRRYGYGDAAVTFDHYREEIDFSDA
ncbi:MAG: hypothetical protein IJ729_00770, partial [Alloprevotella sp.]|nr:hypothetical protein [Alloprevotella sp.]